MPSNNVISNLEKRLASRIGCCIGLGGQDGSPPDPPAVRDRKLHVLLGVTPASVTRPSLFLEHFCTPTNDVAAHTFPYPLHLFAAPRLTHVVKATQAGFDSFRPFASKTSSGVTGRAPVIAENTPGFSSGEGSGGDSRSRIARILIALDSRRGL